LLHRWLSFSAIESVFTIVVNDRLVFNAVGISFAQEMFCGKIFAHGTLKNKK